MRVAFVVAATMAALLVAACDTLSNGQQMQFVPYSQVPDSTQAPR